MAFLGINNIKYFVGVVEDRHDPLKVGRLRVRCLGIHTSDKNKVATADLPWASVSLPTTASGISGLGQSPSFIVEGSWVWGYFRDGDVLMQELVVVGTLPGRPSELGNPNKGFYDPNRRSEENTDEDESNYNLSVYPRESLEPDTNRLAVNNADKEHTSLTLRKLARITGIPTADFDAVGNNITASDTDTWSQPEITYNAVYPYNHVFESESGHVKEYDDTTDYTRIHERHRSGTGYEITHNGDKIDIITNNHYTLTSNNHKAYIQGDSDITIDGRHKVYINKSGQANNNYDIQVGPNANVNIQVDNGNLNVVTKTGQFNFDVGADFNVNVGGNYNLTVLGNKVEQIEGSHTQDTTGAVTIKGSTIDLNP
jgi:hypothetical protein